MDFRSRGSKSIRGSPSSTRTKIGKKCPPFGLTVQADLYLRRIEEYFGTPRSCGGTNPSSTANALRKDLRRAYLESAVEDGESSQSLSFTLFTAAPSCGPSHFASTTFGWVK